MPREAAFMSLLLRRCILPSAIRRGKQIHAQISVRGCFPHATLETDLLLMYSRCGNLGTARRVFDEMTVRSMHSWNIMISSYVQASLFEEALCIFTLFSKSDLLPDHYTLPSLFKICAGTGDLCLGRKLHALATTLGFEDHLVVGSATLDMYSKSGSLIEAGKVFSQLSQRDVVVWNSMISGYVRGGFSTEALILCTEMQMEGAKMDVVTVSSLLGACMEEGELMKGKEIHGQAMKRAEFDADIVIGNSLVDMYAKCGSLCSSQKVFTGMQTKNLVTWTTMISCYGMHGKGEESLELFKKMMLEGFTPNSVTLTAILASCSHSGLIGQGQRIFGSMKSKFGIEPSVEHYACMVHLLGRSGLLDKALELIHSMRMEPTSSVWGALLGACVVHKNVELGEISGCQLFELEPRNCSNYIALCSIYEAVGRWDGVSRIRSRMKELNLIKNPGCSWINIEGRVHIFYQGSASRHRIKSMLDWMLDGLSELMQISAYG